MESCKLHQTYNKKMGNVYFNRIKAALAEKVKTGTWLSEQTGRDLGTVSRWMTNKSSAIGGAIA